MEGITLWLSAFLTTHITAEKASIVYPSPTITREQDTKILKLFNVMQWLTLAGSFLLTSAASHHSAACWRSWPEDTSGWGETLRFPTVTRVHAWTAQTQLVIKGNHDGAQSTGHRSCFNKRRVLFQSSEIILTNKVGGLELEGGVLVASTM